MCKRERPLLPEEQRSGSIPQAQLGQRVALVIEKFYKYSLDLFQPCRRRHGVGGDPAPLAERSPASFRGEAALVAAAGGDHSLAGRAAAAGIPAVGTPAPGQLFPGFPTCKRSPPQGSTYRRCGPP